MNPFLLNDPVIPPIFAGRSGELAKLRESIVLNNKSVSVSGYNGIGKSSLILTLLGELESDNQAVFPVSISEKQFRDYLLGDFLSIIAHEICTEIWIRVLGGRFSELLEQTLLYPRDTAIDSKHKSLIKRIFRIVTSENLGSKGSHSSSLGGKLVIEGRTAESNEFSLSRKPLVSFEFLLLIDELMEVLSERGFNRIVIVCDQLNHIPPKANYEIVSQYFEVLSSKNITFIVSAIHNKLNKKSEFTVNTEIMLKSLGQWIELGSFSNSSDIRKFTNNCMIQSGVKQINFQDDFFEEVFNLCEGYPWFTTKLMAYMYQAVVNEQRSEIMSRDIEKYGARFARAISVYKNMDGDLPMHHFESILNS